jgi:predicted GTPase
MEDKSFSEERSDIEFAEYKDRVQDWLERCERLATQAPSSVQALQTDLGDATSLNGQDPNLRIAVLGEYSAGKSSLIAALTGQEIEIDADIETEETSEYEYRGVRLIDTPGVQAQQEESKHDKIAQNAVRGADLILFVVTNELFNDRLSDLLHYVIDDDHLGLAEKTMVVINKVDREPEGTMPQLEIEVSKVTQPHDIPIVACAAKKYLDSERSDLPSNLKKKFREQSRLGELRTALNQFVRARGALGKMVTPLQKSLDVLEEMRDTASSYEKEHQDEVERLRRQRKLVQDALRSARQLARSMSRRVRAKVLEGSEMATEELSSDAGQEEFEDAYLASLEEIKPELDELMEESGSRLRENIENLIDQLEADAAAGEQESVSLDAPGLEEEAPHDEISFSSDGYEDEAEYLKNVLKAGGKDLLEEAADPKRMRDIVYKVGKGMGKKFKPWEAVNAGKAAAKWAGRAGKALPFLAAGLDYYMALKEEEKRIDNRANRPRCVSH